MRLEPGNYPEWVNYGAESLLPFEIRVGDYVDILGSRAMVVDFDVRRRRLYDHRGAEVSMAQAIEQGPRRTHSEGTLLVDHTIWTFHLEGGQTVSVFGDDILFVWRHRLGAGVAE